MPSSEAFKFKIIKNKNQIENRTKYTEQNNQQQQQHKYIHTRANMLVNLFSCTINEVGQGGVGGWKEARPLNNNTKAESVH